MQQGRMSGPVGLGSIQMKRAQLNFGRLNCGGTPILVLITHCCAMDRMLLVIQYKTKPEGKKKNITLKMSGMNHIILACMGSGGAGLRAVCSKVDRVMTIGKMK